MGGGKQGALAGRLLRAPNPSLSWEGRQVTSQGSQQGCWGSQLYTPARQLFLAYVLRSWFVNGVATDGPKAQESSLSGSLLRILLPALFERSGAS